MALGNVNDCKQSPRQAKTPNSNTPTLWCPVSVTFRNREILGRDRINSGPTLEPLISKQANDGHVWHGTCPQWACPGPWCRTITFRLFHVNKHKQSADTREQTYSGEQAGQGQTMGGNVCHMRWAGRRAMFSIVREKLENIICAILLPFWGRINIFFALQNDKVSPRAQRCMQNPDADKVITSILSSFAIHSSCLWLESCSGRKFWTVGMEIRVLHKYAWKVLRFPVFHFKHRPLSLQINKQITFTIAARAENQK